MLNLIGTRDHLVPRDASTALKSLVASADYTALEFDLGHIGMYISARAQREVPAAIARWHTGHEAPFHGRLAAMRWPERVLMFHSDDPPIKVSVDILPAAMDA